MRLRLGFSYFCAFILLIKRCKCSASGVRKAERVPNSSNQADSVSSGRQASTSLCPPGYYGSTCEKKCPDACGQACDRDGLCTICSHAGVQLPHCTDDCNKGFYGVNCKLSCSSDCRDTQCDPESGNCLQCQTAGLRLPTCTLPCSSGTYGYQCEKACPAVCREACDRLTGACLVCEYGDGPQCHVNCARQEDSEACERYCPVRCVSWCNTSTSTCSMCSPGYQPPDCDKPCREGFYGNNCGKRCSERCKDGRCDPASGICHDCTEGYVGRRCNGRCIPGFYGEECLLKCPDTCVDSICDFVTGDCIKCAAGYKGKQCDQLCIEGTHGDGCGHVCPPTCIGKCDPISGQCSLCSEGYIGPLCNDTCNQGYYGLGCLKTCPSGCQDDLCDHVNGHCQACKADLQGLLCEEPKPPNNDLEYLGPAIFVLAALLIPMVVMGLAVVAYKKLFNKYIGRFASRILKKRKRKRSEKPTTIRESTFSSVSSSFHGVRDAQSELDITRLRSGQSLTMSSPLHQVEMSKSSTHLPDKGKERRLKSSSKPGKSDAFQKEGHRKHTTNGTVEGKKKRLKDNRAKRFISPTALRRTSTSGGTPSCSTPESQSWPTDGFFQVSGTAQSQSGATSNIMSNQRSSFGVSTTRSSYPEAGSSLTGANHSSISTTEPKANRDVQKAEGGRSPSGFNSPLVHKVRARHKGSIEPKLPLSEMQECSMMRKTFSTSYSVVLPSSEPIYKKSMEPQVTALTQSHRCQSSSTKHSGSVDSLFGIPSAELSPDTASLNSKSAAKQSAQCTDEGIQPTRTELAGETSAVMKLINHPRTFSLSMMTCGTKASMGQSSLSQPKIPSHDLNATRGSAPEVCQNREVPHCHPPETPETSRSTYGSEINREVSYTRMYELGNFPGLEDSQTNAGGQITTSFRNQYTGDDSANEHDSWPGRSKNREASPTSQSSRSAIISPRITTHLQPNMRQTHLEMPEEQTTSKYLLVKSGQDMAEVSRDLQGVASITCVTSTVPQSPPFCRESSSVVNMWARHDLSPYGVPDYARDQSHGLNIAAERMCYSPESTNRRCDYKTTQEEKNNVYGVEESQIKSATREDKVYRKVSPPKLLIAVEKQVSSQELRESPDKSHSSYSDVSGRKVMRSDSVACTVNEKADLQSKGQQHDPRKTLDPGLGLRERGRRPEDSSTQLVRCHTTRQVSPSSRPVVATTNRLMPLPTPPPEGRQSLRPLQIHSQSSSSNESEHQQGKTNQKS